jgi:hypothetical protein
MYPLQHLAAATPVGHSLHTTIHRSHSFITVPVGTTGYLGTPTILLSFDLPRWVLNRDASGAIHVPLAMWSNREPTRAFLSLDDDRPAELQVGDSEVRAAIYYHLIARWRAVQRRTGPSTINSLFGQTLLRYFVSARPTPVGKCTAKLICT